MFSDQGSERTKIHSACVDWCFKDGTKITHFSATNYLQDVSSLGISNINRTNLIPRTRTQGRHVVIGEVVEATLGLSANHRRSSS